MNNPTYNDFDKWLKETRPGVQLLPWQENFVKTRLGGDKMSAAYQVQQRGSRSGRTFVMDLVLAFERAWAKEHGGTVMVAVPRRVAEDFTQGDSIAHYYAERKLRDRISKMLKEQDNE